MNIQLNNPLTLLSINILGIGIDVTFDRTKENAELPPENSITLFVNCPIGKWSHSWSV